MSAPTKPAVRSGTKRTVDAVERREFVVDGVDYGRYVVFEKWTDQGDGCKFCVTIEGLLDDDEDEDASEGRPRVFEWKSFNIFADTSTAVPVDYAQRKQQPGSRHVRHIRASRWNPALVPLTKESERVIQLEGKHENDEHYLTHDNGGRPFVVYVSRSTSQASSVSVYKRPNSDSGFFVPDEIYSSDEEETWCYVDHVVTYEQVDQVLIGRSPPCKMTNSSGGVGEAQVGNSILLRLPQSDTGYPDQQHRYAFVGSTVVEFQLPEKVDTFVSLVGNNDVPYSVGFGNNHIFFFEPERVIQVRNQDFPDQALFLENNDDSDPEWAKRANRAIDLFNDGLSPLPEKSQCPILANRMVCEAGFE